MDFVIAEPGNLATGAVEKVKAKIADTAASLTPEQQALYGEAFSTFADGFVAMQQGLGLAPSQRGFRFSGGDSVITRGSAEALRAGKQALVSRYVPRTLTC